MVNEKQTKRERNIKSKLMAAIAMLLVSSIMMVSTTYAWFTLSTAPEVTGITTTIGANGNLEIALSPVDGVPSKVGNATPGTAADKTVSNLTWGNLVDMADEAYNLANLSLSPAQLVFAGTDGEYTLSSTPLAIPSYGNDGRISALTPKAEIGGTTMLQSAAGYTAGGGQYGVRAVGTASNQSIQSTALKNSTSQINDYSNKAAKAAGDSLKDEKGNALASILVAHVRAGEPDGTNYTEYKDDLTAIVSELENSVGYIEDALRAAFVGMAATLEKEAYTAAATYIAEAESIDAIVTKMGEYAANVPAMKTVLDAMTAENGIITKYNAVAADVAEARTAVNALGDTVAWSNISTILTKLMNIDADDTITVGGFDLATLKANKSNMLWLYQNVASANPLIIELGAGSGVYYNIAELSKNMTASTSASIDAGGMLDFPEGTKLDIDNVVIRTNYAGTTMLTGLRTSVSGLTPGGGGSSTNMDVFYGYVVDLMLRTNASGSNLLLQPEGAQRIYSDATNEHTQGSGAQIVFTADNAADLMALERLCQSIQVVFFDPTAENKVLGVAKVVDTTADDTTVTGQLSLWSFTVGENGLVTLDETNKRTYTDVADTTNIDESQVLCSLVQNQVQAVSVLVCLDGNNVYSSDMLAEGKANGVLNLQFASSAQLVPMQNSELKNGTTAEGGEEDDDETPATTTPAAPEGGEEQGN